MEGPTQETIVKALIMAREIADEVWKEGKWSNAKYVSEKRERNQRFNPEGRIDNFPFYLGQFDANRQLIFVVKLSEQPESDASTLLKAMCLGYFGITAEEINKYASPKDGDEK
jgi:hypothetical protein